MTKPFKIYKLSDGWACMYQEFNLYGVDIYGVGDTPWAAWLRWKELNPWWGAMVRQRRQMGANIFNRAFDNA